MTKLPLVTGQRLRASHPPHKLQQPLFPPRFHHDEEENRAWLQTRPNEDGRERQDNSQFPPTFPASPGPTEERLYKATVTGACLELDMNQGEFSSLIIGALETSYAGLIEARDRAKADQVLPGP